MSKFKKNRLPDFSGKCLSIKIEGSSYMHDLFDPQFEVQGGRLFLTGHIPEGASESNWADGSTAAIVWKNVSDYIVFDDLESYVRAIKKLNDYHQQDNS